MNASILTYNPKSETLSGSYDLQKGERVVISKEDDKQNTVIIEFGDNVLRFSGTPDEVIVDYSGLAGRNEEVDLLSL